jgi:hypothetical protein
VTRFRPALAERPHEREEKQREEANMPNVHDDDEESLWFADESEWLDDDEDE